ARASAVAGARPCSRQANWVSSPTWLVRPLSCASGSSPSTATVPPVSMRPVGVPLDSSRPPRSRRSVDVPEPTAPSTAVMVPGTISRLMSSSAGAALTVYMNPACTIVAGISSLADQLRSARQRQHSRHGSAEEPEHDDRDAYTHERLSGPVPVVLKLNDGSCRTESALFEHFVTLFDRDQQGGEQSHHDSRQQPHSHPPSLGRPPASLPGFDHLPGAGDDQRDEADDRGTHIGHAHGQSQSAQTVEEPGGIGSQPEDSAQSDQGGHTQPDLGCDAQPF